MTDPATLFGDYLTPEVGLPITEWQSGALVFPSPADEVHPLGEVVWDYLEKTCVLDEHGFSLYTETRGLVRSMLDGVTGYTVFYTNTDNPQPKFVRVLEGGDTGMHVEDILGTHALNINFHEPLPKSRTLRLHWLIELPSPPANAQPQRGMAEVTDTPTQHLTLRVQFDDRRLPVRPRYYQARPRFLLRSIGPVRPLELQPGNIISYTWPRTEEGMAYVLTWNWPEDLKVTQQRDA